MSKLDSEQAILSLAAGLQVNWQQNAVQNIIALCHRKISSWLKGAPGIHSIKQLEQLVCERVRLVFEEVWSDEDLNKVIQKYIKMGEPIFATLKSDLDDKTFATLIERRKVDGNSRDRYVAIIDCRGAKALRRFFTRWHEIAHLLTLEGQLELPLHRSTTNKSPTERLMDIIAGEIGFYDPLFQPILLEEILKDGSLTLNAADRIRERFCPEASFHATLNACASRTNSPVMLTEVGLGLKRDEERESRSMQGNLFPAPRPQPKLRALTVVPNAAARAAGMQIHRNMEVPSSSLLYKAFFKRDGIGGADFKGSENLSTWRHSKGTLAGYRVTIEARLTQNTIVALILPE